MNRSFTYRNNMDDSYFSFSGAGAMAPERTAPVSLSTYFLFSLLFLLPTPIVDFSI